MNYLRRILILAFVWIINFSCEEDQSFQVEWGIFEFPGEGTLYATYGDLQEYFLVSTPPKSFVQPMVEILEIPLSQYLATLLALYALNDDLYAISNFTDYISHDQGLTWEALAFDHPLDAGVLNFND